MYLNATITLLELARRARWLEHHHHPATRAAYYELLAAMRHSEVPPDMIAACEARVAALSHRRGPRPMTRMWQ